MKLTYIGKKTFFKNSVYFRKFSDFEADKEIDFSGKRKKTKINEKIPVCNRYYKISELNDVLKSGY